MEPKIFIIAFSAGYLFGRVMCGLYAIQTYRQSYAKALQDYRDAAVDKREG